MITNDYQASVQRRTAFTDALEQLLVDHGAEMTIEDRGADYVPNPVINITMDSVYDKSDLHKAFTEFELDTSINP